MYDGLLVIYKFLFNVSFNYNTSMPEVLAEHWEYYIYDFVYEIFKHTNKKNPFHT